MAIVKAVSSRAPIAVAIDYITKEEKTDERLLTGIGVSPFTAKDEMETTKELYNKTGGRTYKHFVQSFAPDEKINPKEAHLLACDFAKRCEQFKGFEVLIATHLDRDHVHSHFIVNSVNAEDGHKFQMSKSDLQSIKDLSDQLCQEHGLSVTEKGKCFDGQERKEPTSFKAEKYRHIKSNGIGTKGERSYLVDTATAVKESLSKARSKEEFVDSLNKKGYSVDWSDNHRHITFCDAEGHKVRDTNLNKTFNMNISKDELNARLVENNESLQRSVNVSFQNHGISR